MRRVVLVLIASLSLLLQHPALAWNAHGHRVAASIAFRRLTPQQRNDVVEILKNHPRFEEDFLDLMPDAIADGPEEQRQEWLFQQAAIWPDLVKGNDPGRKPFNRPKWHFINRPHFLAPADREELEDTISVNLLVEPPFSSFDDKEMNVVQALVNSVRIIGSPSADDGQSAVHVCWLLHNAADLAQPLHSTALFSRHLFPSGDKGGNAIDTEPFDNLHAAWDAAIGTSQKFETIHDTAVALSNDRIDEMDAAAETLDPVVWWHESAKTAGEHVYVGVVLESLQDLEAEEGDIDDSPVQLDGEYLNQRKETSQIAVAKAGARCAALLAALVDDEADAEEALADVLRLDSSDAEAPSLRRRIEELTAQLVAMGPQAIELQPGGVQPIAPSALPSVSTLPETQTREPELKTRWKLIIEFQSER